MGKKTRINLLLILALFLCVLAAAFFYLPSVLGDTVYPLKYADLIKKYSTLYGVDPSLVAAVIMQESRFDPSARSSAGAQGLMQFMPGTANTMAKETGRTTYDIFDAETSVQFGAAHIRDLLVKYNGNVDAALAGYNAGTGNADRWLAAGMLNNLPAGETSHYIVNVKNYRQIYATLYANELGLAGTQYDVKVQKQEKPVYTTFWGMFFKNVFGTVKPNSETSTAPATQ